MSQLTLFWDIEIKSFIFKNKEYRKLKLLNKLNEKQIFYLNDAACKGYDPDSDFSITFFESLGEREEYYREYKKNYYNLIYWEIKKIDYIVFDKIGFEAEKDYFWDIIFWIYIFKQDKNVTNVTQDF